MASVKIKGKRVIGTKKKDEITWLNKSAWNKALTVKAGAGNDVINFKKSKYNNTIYGEAGNDKIYGGNGNDKIYGGKNNDTINAGKGKNTLYFSKGDGTDTVVKGGGVDTLVFSNEKLKNIKAKYSKNDVLLTYTDGKIKLKNYVKNGHSAQYIQVGKTKKAIEALLPWNTVKRSGRNYIGTNKKDKVDSNTRNAVIKTYNGNDKVGLIEYDNTVIAGKGNDTIINDGSGTVLKFNAGDGNDTVNISEDSYYTMFEFLDEKDINGVKYTAAKGGFKLTYNGGKDSVTIKMATEKYEDWVEDGGIQDFLIKIRNDYYTIISPEDGIKNLYTQWIIRGIGEIETPYADFVDTLRTSNNDDYINYVSAAKIYALDGDDYISVSGYNEEDAIVNIWGGKGNDYINVNNADLYFNNGDGNDWVSGENTLVFSDVNSINDLSIDKNNDGFIIKYNNKDSVQLDLNEYSYYDYNSYIKVGDNFYTLYNTSNYYWGRNAVNSIALVGTIGDDTIGYNYYEDSIPDTIYTGTGNDIINVESGSSSLHAYFNIDADNHLLDSTLFIDCGNWLYGIDSTDPNNSYSSEGILKVADYFSKGTTEINSSDSCTLNMSNIEEVKTAVAGWLSTHTDYANVMVAINDSVNGSENLRILMGSDYFGKLNWQANS